MSREGKLLGPVCPACVAALARAPRGSPAAGAAGAGQVFFAGPGKRNSPMALASAGVAFLTFAFQVCEINGINDLENMIAGQIFHSMEP